MDLFLVPQPLSLSRSRSGVHVCKYLAWPWAFLDSDPIVMQMMKPHLSHLPNTECLLEKSPESGTILAPPGFRQIQCQAIVNDHVYKLKQNAPSKALKGCSSLRLKALALPPLGHVVWLCHCFSRREETIQWFPPPTTCQSYGGKGSGWCWNLSGLRVPRYFWSTEMAESHCRVLIPC